MQYKIKKDKYQRARGGRSKIYNIFCEGCNSLLFVYQKDGDGILKRCYLDRILENISYHKFLYLNYRCSECNQTFGTATTYKKENRPAMRLYMGAIYKRALSR